MTPSPGSVEEHVQEIPCPVCESPARTTWMDDGKSTRYVRCLRCRTVYASPKAPSSARYSWLDASFGVGDKAFSNALSRRPALAKEAALIQQYVDRGRMLDIGCDLGDFFEWFVPPRWQCYGVELSPSAAAHAASVYRADVFTGTVRQASYEPGCFDLVTMIDLLYYLEDPIADLQEVAAILRPNGFLAIEVTGQTYQLWRSRGPICWLLERRWTRLQTDSAYLLWPTPAGLKTLLERCRFRIVGWHVLPSPETTSGVQRSISRTYYSIISGAGGRYFNALRFVPKYLCVAQLSDQ